MNLRLIRGMTQSDLCDRISELGDVPVTVAAESMWESGKRQISPTHLHYIAMALDVMEQDLFDWDSPNEQDRVRAIIKATKYSEHERQILRYAALDWPGDTHALIEYIGIGLSLPPEERADGYNYGIWIYENARKKGRVIKRPFDVNMKLIKKKLEILEDI